MKCYVYRSTRRQDAYVFLPAEDAFDELPADLLRQLGRLEFALAVEITPERELARTDGATVLEAVNRQGFYLQMPREGWQTV